MKNLRAGLVFGLVSCLGVGLVVGVANYRSSASEKRGPGPTRFAGRAPVLPAGHEPPPLRIPDELALKQIYVVNHSAFIPPQCYTKTIDDDGSVHNPCYTCHLSSRAPNYIDDGDIQLEYAFVSRARNNPWKNLFVDWTPLIGKISDEEILRYIGESNYFDEQGGIILAQVLARPPTRWDHGNDGVWRGFIPDAYFAFDDEGFDRTPERG